MAGKKRAGKARQKKRARAPAKKKRARGETVYLVPHTHYDAVWVFTKEDYLYINIYLILKRAAALAEKSPSYRFLLEQAYLLEKTARRYPALFEKLRLHVAAGRMEIAGGEYLMEDLMLPQGETLVRNIQEGRRFVENAFGVRPSVMWQADSFGLNAQLPQIYQKSGYRFLAFRRGCPEKAPSEFWWEGLDGSRILTHFMPLGYRAGLDLSRLEKSYKALKACAATRHLLMPSGSGVTLPQEEARSAVRRWNRRHKETRMRFATPSEFFRALEQERARLPVRRGEMYSGRHSEVFPSVASSRIWVKQGLRASECTALSFERLATACALAGGPGFSEELAQWWKKIFFLALHDGVPGTGIDEVYRELRQNAAAIQAQAGHLWPELFDAALAAPEGAPRDGVAVFNPLAWPAQDWVEAELSFEKGAVHRIAGVKSDAEEAQAEVLAAQRYADGSLKRARIGFVARAPPLGLRVYRLLARAPPPPPRARFVRRGNAVQNRFFTLRFSPEHGMVEAWKGGRRLFWGNELVLEEEHGDLYYHRSAVPHPVKTEGGEGVKYGLFRLRDFSVRASPLRARVRAVLDYYALRWPYRLTDRVKPLLWRHPFLSVEKTVTVYRDLDRVDFFTRVHNRHPRVRLRVRFNTPFTASSYVCDTAFGAVTRATDVDPAAGEGWREAPTGLSPCLRWLDYGDGRRGLTVLNRGTPEAEVRGGAVYLTLLRAVDLLSNGSAGPVIPVPDARELKTHAFSYAVRPHRGDWRAGQAYRHGHVYNYPLQALPVSSRARPKAPSFLSLAPEHLVLTAFRAAGEDAAVVRFYEAEGKKATARVRFFRRPAQVRVTNLLEEEDPAIRKRVSLRGRTARLSVSPFEIVTLKALF